MESTPPAVGIDELDETQRVVLQACTAACRISVVGAPGTGKTALLSAIAQREVALARGTAAPDEADASAREAAGALRPMPRIALLTQDRRAAAELRTRLSMALGGLPDSVTVQTLTAFSFSLVQAYAQAVGRRDPELISGPDEDAMLGEILLDSASGVEFPAFVNDDVRALPSFRAEIRNLITRAAELGYGPGELESLGEQKSEPMWVSGAQVMRAYELLTEAQDAFAGTSSAPDRLDHAQLVGAAASLLARWEKNVAESPAGGGCTIPRPHWDWILVDDIQNAPRSVLALLDQLALDGASLVVAGDPDSAVQGFRGGVASLPGDVTLPKPRGIGCEPVFLGRRHRGGEAIADLADNLTQRIRVGGSVVTHRRPAAPGVRDQVIGQRFVHAEEETAAIARMVRTIHHREGIPYSSMAIITRSRAAHPALRGSLVRRGVPVEQIGSDQPLRFHPAVASLLDAVRLALGIPNEEGLPDLRTVLVSAIVGIDPLHLRRMSRTLRGWELSRGGGRNEERLLELILEDPRELQELAPEGVKDLVEVSRIFANIRDAAAKSANQAEEVLWAAWESSGRAEVWRRQALEGGLEGDHADASLDAIIQLFRVAQRMADRNPESTIEQLLAELSLQDLPEDSIARIGAISDAVTLTTPSASQGREWDVVVISGLQDGAWPNLRLRDTYTHTSRLAQIATGREAPGATSDQQRHEAFQDILDDELRQLLHSLGRARERLVITCVDSDDSQPSRFFEAMGFEYEEERENGQEPTSRPALLAPRAQPAELDMAGLVGQLRRARAVGGDTVTPEALLRSLAEAGVPEAQHRMWFDELDPTPEALTGEGQEQIHVSPSRVESLLACPLRGFLSAVGAEDFDNRAAAKVGTLIHSVAEALPHGTRSELMSLFEQKWRAEFDDPELSYSAYRDYAAAQEMIENLALYLAAHPEPVASEQRIRVEVDEHTVLSASLDRVTRTGDGVYIADFKTGKIVPSDPAIEDNVQMQLYQWAVTQLPEYGQSAGAELVYLSRYMTKANMPAVKQQPPLDEEMLARARQRIEEAARVLSGKVFAANPTEKLCRNCQFHGVCPSKPEGRMFS